MAHFVRHDIAQKSDVPWVDTHSMLRHGVLNFIDDSPSGCLDAQHLRNLNDVV